MERSSNLPRQLEDIRAGVRQWEKGILRALQPMESSIEEFYDTAPMPDGHQNILKIARPRLVSQKTCHPLIILFHGGAMVSGSVEVLTKPARDFAQKFGAVVISVGYRLAPENAFPTPILDCWDTFLWLAKNAPTKFGAQLRHGFVVGGYSSGGKVAAVLAQLAQDRKISPPLTGLFLANPMLLVAEIVPEQYKSEWRSRKLKANAKNTFPDRRVPLDDKSLKQVVQYSGEDIKSPLFSPFNSLNPHRGLPPTYISVAGMDPLRDDGLIYGKVLHDHGVLTRIDLYPHLVHADRALFVHSDGRSNVGPKTMKAMEWLLGNSVIEQRNQGYRHEKSQPSKL